MKDCKNPKCDAKDLTIPSLSVLEHVHTEHTETGNTLSIFPNSRHKFVIVVASGENAEMLQRLIADNLPGGTLMGHIN